MTTRERTQNGSTQPPQPVYGRLGASILGPANPTREAENPDILVPPRVDHGTLPNLRWSLAAAADSRGALLVRAHLRIDESVLARIPPRKIHRAPDTGPG